MSAEFIVDAASAPSPPSEKAELPHLCEHELFSWIEWIDSSATTCAILFQLAREVACILIGAPARCGLGSSRKRVGISPLDVTAVDVSSSAGEGLVGRTLAVAHELALHALPRRLQVKLDTVRSVMFPHVADMRIDELTVADGSILLSRYPS